MRRPWAAGAAIVMCLALGGVPVVGQELSSDAGVGPASYVHPEVLVDADWVAAHLDDPTVRIVDARVDGAALLVWSHPRCRLRRHLRRALLPLRHHGCRAVRGADAARRASGTTRPWSSTTPRVVRGAPGCGGRCGTTATKTPRLLDGGLDAWEAEGLPLEKEAPLIEPADFTAEVRPEWYVAMDEVRAAIDDPAISIVDALPADSYVYEHIPTAVSLPAPDLLDTTGVVKGAEDLSAMLEEAGLDPAQSDHHLLRRRLLRRLRGLRPAPHGLRGRGHVRRSAGGVDESIPRTR